MHQILCGCWSLQVYVDGPCSPLPGQEGVLPEHFIVYLHVLVDLQIHYKFQGKVLVLKGS